MLLPPNKSSQTVRPSQYGVLHSQSQQRTIMIMEELVWRDSVSGQPTIRSEAMGAGPPQQALCQPNGGTVRFSRTSGSSRLRTDLGTLAGER